MKNELTRQEIFNKVAIHLISQGRKAFSSEGECLYKTKEGLKCAIGCLIDAEDYDSTLENKRVSNLLMKKYLKDHCNINVDLHRNFFISLQNIHDGYDPGLWKDKLISFGEEYYLDLPECLSKNLGE